MRRDIALTAIVAAILLLLILDAFEYFEERIAALERRPRFVVISHKEANADVS